MANLAGYRCIGGLTWLNIANLRYMWVNGVEYG